MSKIKNKSMGKIVSNQYNEIINMEADYEYGKWTGYAKSLVKFYFPDGCSVCKSEVVLADSIEIYGKSFGNIYLCTNKECKAYVGVHKETTKNSVVNQPLGIMADAELRHWKKKAHFYFDKLWKNKITTRKDSYFILSAIMNLKKENAHIGMFNVYQCKLLIKKLNMLHEVFSSIKQKDLEDESIL